MRLPHLNLDALALDGRIDCRLATVIGGRAWRHFRLIDVHRLRRRRIRGLEARLAGDWCGVTQVGARGIAGVCVGFIFHNEKAFQIDGKDLPLTGDGDRARQLQGCGKRKTEWTRLIH